MQLRRRILDVRWRNSRPRDLRLTCRVDAALVMFQVGEHVEGMVVQIYCPGGISVDVGCSDTFAFLEVEARLGFSETSTNCFQRLLGGVRRWVSAEGAVQVQARRSDFCEST